jgi:hypothetical protein
MLAFWIVLGTLLFTGIIIGIASKAGNSSRRRQMEKLREKLNGSPVRDAHLLGYKSTMPAFDVELEGKKLTLGITFANKMQLCAVEVKRDRLPLIVFRRERPLDRIGRTLFLNREVQTGDNGFDDQVYIETDEEEYLIKRALEKPEARDAVRAAVAEHRAIITSQEGVGGTVLFAQDLDKTVAGVRAALAPLGRIADELPAGDQLSGARGVRASARGDWLGIAMLVGFILNYFLIGFVPHLKPDRWEPWMTAQEKSVEHAVGWTFLAFVVLSFFWIRGHSRSLRNFLITLIFGALSIPWILLQSLYTMNAVLDHSPVVEHPTTVTKKSSRSTRYNTYYSLTFPSLFTPGQLAGIDIDYDTWKTIAVGDRIFVGLRDGKFGWRWCDSVRRDDALKQ